MPDESLMVLVQRAHNGALTELYSRYKRLVYSLAIGIVNDRTLAEEITPRYLHQTLGEI